MLAAITSQAGKLMHCSNLYLTEQQGQLAERLVGHFGGPPGGKVFFANSGAEANEGLFKLARRVGMAKAKAEAGGSISCRGAGGAAELAAGGRFEIITATNSFHGRTLAAIAATGQDKIKAGFGPLMPGFAHVPFNDLAAVERAVTPTTAAVLVEGVQGEGGITPATPEFLRGLRALCDRHGILLLMDGVQCGHFRTGRFQSYETILGSGADDFRPDACSMAKSLGAGFPIGAFWCAPAYADALSAGSHGTTYGGNPLACAVANAVLDVVERDALDVHVRDVGAKLFAGLEGIRARHPDKVKDVRGLGFMVGLVLHDDAAGVDAATGDAIAPAGKLVPDLHALGMLTVPAGLNVVRLLPALNTPWEEMEEALQILEQGVEGL